MTNKLWYEKYRPSTLDDYIWRDDSLREKVSHWVTHPDQLPHMIIEGPPGTGKTSLALLLKTLLEIPDEDFMFLNTSKDAGIDMARKIQDFCEFGGFGGLKLVLLDEAERMTPAAQDAFRGIYDQFSDVVRFIFTCNNIRRVSDAIKSRARTITIDALEEVTFIQRLADIYMAEASTDEIDENDANILYDIMEKYQPDLRKAIDTLQDCFRDGKLIPMDQASAKDSAVWETALLGALKGGTLASLREIVMSIRSDELIWVYRYLVDHIETLFPEHESEALVLINDHHWRHSQVAFPDINLLSLIDKIRQL